MVEKPRLKEEYWHQLTYICTDLRMTPHALYAILVFTAPDGQEWQIEAASFYYDLTPTYKEN